MVRNMVKRVCLCQINTGGCTVDDDVCPGCCDAGWSGPCTMWGSDGYLRGRISKLRYREIIYFKKKGLVQQSIYTSVAGNVTALHCFAAWIATNAIHLSISVLYEEPIIYLLCSLLLAPENT
jgi:hypothetical protein